MATEMLSYSQLVSDSIARRRRRGRWSSHCAYDARRQTMVGRLFFANKIGAPASSCLLAERRVAF